MSQDWLQLLDESVANLAGSTEGTGHVQKKAWEVQDHTVKKNQDHDTTKTTREEIFLVKDAYATSEIKGTEARNVQIPLEDGFSNSLALRKLTKDDEHEESCSYGSPGSVPFSWEAEPGKPKHPQKIEALPPFLSPPPPLSLSSSFKSNNSNKSNSSVTDSHQRSLSGMVKGIFNLKGKASPSRKFQRSHSSLSRENFNSNGKESPLRRRSHISDSFLLKEANSDFVLPSPHPLPLPLPPSPSPTTTLYGPGSSPKSSTSVSPLHSHQSSGRSQHTDIADHLPPLISHISFKGIHDFDIVDPLSASKDSIYASDPIDPQMESVEPSLLDPSNPFLESKDPFPMSQDSGQNGPCDPPFPASFTQSEHLVTQGMKPTAMSDAVPRSPISNSRLSFDLGGPWEHVLHTDGKSTYKLKAKSGPFPKPKRKVNNVENMVTTSTAAPTRQASKLTGIGSLSFAEGMTRRDCDSKHIEDWIEEGAKGLIQGENDDDDDENDEDDYLNYSFPRSRFTAMEMESDQGDENENGSEFSIEFNGQVGRWSSGRIRSINHAIESEAGFKAEEVIRSVEEVRFVISPVATAFVFANSGSDMYSENVGSLESLQIQSASDDYYVDADPSKSAKLQQSHIKWGTYTNKRWFTWGWKVPKLKVPHCLRCHHGATNSFG